MNYANYEDIVSQLRSAGLLLDTVKKSNGGTIVGELYVESSKSVRCDISGERKKQSGAYWLHELRLSDGIWLTGAYWLDHGNTSFKLELRKLCSKCGADMPLSSSTCICGSTKTKAREIPAEQLEAHKKRMQEARRQAEAEAKADAERAAQWADAVWLKCREIFSPDEHDYLTRKKLKSAHGARVFDSNDGIMLSGAEKEDYEYLARFHGALVIPLLDKAGRRRGLQFILSREKHKDWLAQRAKNDKGDKEYWPKGMIAAGNHFVIGGQMHGVGLEAEGFATAATLQEATNLPVAIAFAANNLGPVGEILWKASRKRLKLLYAADDDWLQRCKECKKITTVAEPKCRHCGQPHGKHNAGIERCKEAALATSGAWIAPQFSEPRPDDRKGPTDFNDLRCAEGEQVVGAQVMGKLSELEWSATPSTGGRVGSALQGGGETARRRAEAVMPLDDIVGRFVPLDDGTGKYVFDLWTNKVASREQMITLLPAGVRGDDIKRHPVWVERGAYYLDQVGFDPAGDDTGVALNTWRGWPMKPRAGKCTLILELLHYLCNQHDNGREVYSWLLKWMAYPLQNPGAKMASAVIMHGPQGTGKSTVFQCLAKIYGDYATVLNQRGIEDKFNSDWADSKLFILAEEVVTRAEMWHIKNELKELVTGEWIRVNPKNIAAYRQRNHINIIYLSNENQPLPLENDDRRHCVIYTPPALDEAFYDEVFLEIESGGIEAFYDYLLNFDLAGFHPKKRPPMTEAKAALIALSLPSEQRFALEWGQGDLGLPVCPALSTDVYAAYQRWCRLNGETRPRPSNQFHGALARMPGWDKRKARVLAGLNLGSSSSETRYVIFPPEHLISKANVRGEAEGEIAWVTGCCLDFGKALRSEDGAERAYG